MTEATARAKGEGPAVETKPFGTSALRDGALVGLRLEAWG